MKPTRRTKRAAVLLALPLLVVPALARAATFYVAPTGSDTNPGTMGQPFGTMSRGQTAAAAGDTVFFRGGTYAYTAGASACSSATATISAVVLNKSGTSAAPIHYWAVDGETPVFDFSG